MTAETYALHKIKGGSAAAWIVRCLAMPLSAVFHVPKVLTSDRLHGVRARLLGIGMLFKMRCWRAIDGLAFVLARRRG